MTGDYDPADAICGTCALERFHDDPSRRFVPLQGATECAACGCGEDSDYVLFGEVKP